MLLRHAQPMSMAVNRSSERLIRPPLAALCSHTVTADGAASRISPSASGTAPVQGTRVSCACFAAQAMIEPAEEETRASASAGSGLAVTPDTDVDTAMQACLVQLGRSPESAAGMVRYSQKQSHTAKYYNHENTMDGCPDLEGLRCRWTHSGTTGTRPPAMSPSLQRCAKHPLTIPHNIEFEYNTRLISRVALQAQAVALRLPLRLLHVMQSLLHQYDSAHGASALAAEPDAQAAGEALKAAGGSSEIAEIDSAVVPSPAPEDEPLSAGVLASAVSLAGECSFGGYSRGSTSIQLACQFRIFAKACSTQHPQLWHAVMSASV